MEKKLDLYLAHSFERRHEFRVLELDLESKYNLNLHNPFFDEMTRKDRRIILAKTNAPAKAFKRTQADCEQLVYRDLNNIDKRDGLLTIIHEPSLGTAFEISHAHKTGKLVFVISEKYSDHAWVRVYADYRFKTMDEFVKWLDKNGYKKKNKSL
jgi:nucleoside 2-deoxyribosyltransferase